MFDYLTLPYLTLPRVPYLTLGKVARANSHAIEPITVPLLCCPLVPSFLRSVGVTWLQQVTDRLVGTWEGHGCFALLATYLTISLSCSFGMPSSMVFSPVRSSEVATYDEVEGGRRHGFFPREKTAVGWGGDGFDDPLIQHRVGCCAREEGGLRSCGAHSGGYTEGRVYARHSRFGTQSCPISHTCPGSVLYGHLMPTVRLRQRQRCRHVEFHPTPCPSSSPYLRY